MLHEPKLTNVILPYCRRAVKTPSPNPHGGETCMFTVSSSERRVSQAASEHDSAGATHAQRMQCAYWLASQRCKLMFEFRRLFCPQPFEIWKCIKNRQSLSLKQWLYLRVINKECKTKQTIHKMLSENCLKALHKIGWCKLYCMNSTQQF